MKKSEWPESVRNLLSEILTDAYGEDEHLYALQQGFQDGVEFPCTASVAGGTVEVLDVDYDGNTRQGLLAQCKTADGQISTLAAWQLTFPADSIGWLHVSAYRMWMNLDGPLTIQTTTATARRRKATPDDIDLTAPIELVVLLPKERGVRCRLLGTVSELTLRTSDAWNMVPGEILTVRGHKCWRYGGHSHLTAEIQSSRLDVSAMHLEPLQLMDEYLWDPAKDYWGEEELTEDWEKAIMAYGPRSSFEMEGVRPGVAPGDWDKDPIIEAIELRNSGDWLGARKQLMELLTEELRCLDAHAHLGSFNFDHQPSLALRHYEMGVRIGERSMGTNFDGLLVWGRLDNRPFMRCMHGYGLCLWRLERNDEAEEVFKRMLWLNPNDNQGIRFLLPQLRAGKRWEELET